MTAKRVRIKYERDGMGKEINFRITLGGDSHALSEAIRNRFQIPAELRLLLCDKDGHDVPIDEALVEESYVLSTVALGVRAATSFSSSPSSASSASSPTSCSIASSSPLSSSSSSSSSSSPSARVSSSRSAPPPPPSSLPASLSDPGDEVKAAELKKKRQVRQETLQELRQSEDAYVASLNTVEKFFVDDKKNVPLEQHKMIFSNWSQLRAKNDEFRRLLAASNDDDIGAPLMFLAQSLPVYSTYSFNQCDGQRMFLQLLQSNPTFASHCATFESNTGHSLQSRLSAPIERIKQYARLLKALQDNSESTRSEEYKVIQLSAKALHELNDTVTAQIERDVLKNLSGKLGLNLLVPNRVFVTKGVLTVRFKPKQNMKPSKFFFYLFSNLLVFGKFSGGQFGQVTQFPITRQEKFEVELVEPGSPNYSKVFVKGFERNSFRRMSQAFSKSLHMNDEADGVAGVGADAPLGPGVIKEGSVNVLIQADLWQPMYFLIKPSGLLAYFVSQPTPEELAAPGPAAAVVASCGGVGLIDLSAGVDLSLTDSAQPTLTIKPKRASGTGVGQQSDGSLVIAGPDVKQWQEAIRTTAAVTEEKNRHYCFKILTKKTNVYVVCADDAELTSWFNEISWCVRQRDENPDGKFTPRPPGFQFLSSTPTASSSSA